MLFRSRNGGYHAAFLAGAVFAVVGAVLGALFLPSEAPQAMQAEVEPARS